MRQKDKASQLFGKLFLQLFSLESITQSKIIQVDLIFGTCALEYQSNALLKDYFLTSVRDVAADENPIWQVRR